MQQKKGRKCEIFDDRPHGNPYRPDSPAGTPGNLTPVFLRNRVFDHPLPVLHQTELFAGHLFNRGR